MQHAVAFLAFTAMAVVTLLTGGTALADSPREGSDEAPAPIYSRALDLLDGEHFMQLRSDSEEWVSESFDTSRFTRIGLKAGASDDSDLIVCRTEWSFGQRDGFTPGQPSVQLGTSSIRLVFPPLGMRDGRDGVPDDDSRLVLLQPPGPAVGLSEVAGQRARIRCRPAVGGDFGRIIDPRDPEVPPPAGTLTDVKVLLRRH